MLWKESGDVLPGKINETFCVTIHKDYEAKLTQAKTNSKKSGTCFYEKNYAVFLRSFP
jgi:hypothetical protein